MARTPARRQEPEPISFDTVRELVQKLPGSVEGTSYGTPAFNVRGELFVRLHQTEDALVVRMGEPTRAMRMRADPETFYVTDHYVAYPWVLVRLSSVSREDLAEVLEEAWRLAGPPGRSRSN